MVKKVLKFGGTSVGTVERIQHVAKIIKKEQSSGTKVIAVLSAMAGKTDELIKLSNEISVSKFEGFKILVHQIDREIWKRKKKI